MSFLIKTTGAEIVKAPGGELDYTVDWAAWLEVDTIVDASVVWTIPSGLEEGATARSNTDTKSTIWLKGGTVGSSYVVLNRITTAGGRIDERQFTIKVENK